ncbi:uncharacterized protein PG998_011969 [Apiospora kogelbergensis]|uniref:uncharacterized protein n=1 Tax=Apiospora kogelbergensis TaxID=1337665 RepID=UPI003130DB81
MHYIRLLRPVSVESSSNRREDTLSVLLTITTDLGDSFFSPDEPLALGLVLESAGGAQKGKVLACPADKGSPLQWRAGMRVLKAQLRLRTPLPNEKTTVRIFARSHQSKAPSPRPYWRHGYEEEPTELVVPVSVDMVNRRCAPVSLRQMPLPGWGDDDDAASDGNGHDLALGEDIGESIARHIWDAGLVTASFLSDSCRSADVMAEMLPMRRHDDQIGILELGCGVGVLGTTLAAVVFDAAAAQGRSLRSAHVLLTDVDEAEERARANIARAEAVLETRRRRRHTEDENERERPPCAVAAAAELQYENLDWDDGRRGRFGPRTAARGWDLVVLSDCTYNVDSLPALLATLRALHYHSFVHDGTDTRVLLATKPRHASEEALFGLLHEFGWSHRVARTIPLPRVGAEDERVDIYVLTKGAGREETAAAGE